MYQKKLIEMGSKETLNMKKATFGILFCLLLLSGCSGDTMQEFDVQIGTFEISTETDTEKTNSDNSYLEQTASLSEETGGESHPIVVSFEEKIAVYDGKIDLARPFVANENYIFCTNNVIGEEEKNIYRIPIGTAEIEKLEVEIPENTHLVSMTVDCDGLLHTLFCTHGEILRKGIKGKVEIRVLDEDGTLVRSIDITDLTQINNKDIDTFSYPRDILVDDEGLYNLWINGERFLLDQDGKLLQTIDLDNMGAVCFGKGRSGKIYCFYSKGEDRLISVINSRTGTFEKEWNNMLDPKDSAELMIAPGTDTDLLSYSFATGFWAWDLTQGTMENRLPFSGLQLEPSEEIAGWSVLRDGRFLAVTYHRNQQEWRFIYKAGGK